MCNLCRKLLLLGKHFFGWLKTANFSTACGTSTLKSPLLRAFFTPHSHPRLRKCLSRCTLDCGFKTSESLALRGFVAGLRTLATAALYLVLKSNGLRHPKNLPVKFDFSPIDTSANIAKKLPPQRCFKPLFIPIFNFSHKRPTFAFTGESGYTHSAHAAKQGRFGRGWYHYPRTVPHVSETLCGRGSKRQTLPLLGLGRVCSRKTQKAFGTAMRLCASRPRWAALPCCRCSFSTI